MSLSSMMKSIVVPRILDQPTLEKAENFFRDLGFTIGEGWSDDHSKGLAFLAPQGCIELVVGEPTVNADLICEVHSVSAAFAVAEQHGVAVAKPEATHWGAEMFVASINGAFRVAFYSINGKGEKPGGFR